MNPTPEERRARLERMAEEYNVEPAPDATDEAKLLVAVGQADVYVALRMEGKND